MRGKLTVRRAHYRVLYRVHYRVLIGVFAKACQTKVLIIIYLVDVRTTSGKCGGGTGIRTLGGLSPSSVFKTGAFDHSATPPTKAYIIARN